MPYVLAALLGGFLLFNNQASPHKVEKLARSALQKRFPGAQVDVGIEGRSGMDVVHGKFRSININVSHFRTAGMLLPMSGAGQVVRVGHVGRVELHFRDFVWNDLPVAAADFAFNDFRYDFGALKRDSQLHVLGAGASEARLVVSAAALQQMVQSRMKDATDLRMQLQGGLLKVSGNYKEPLLGNGIPFTLSARPEIHGGREIWLADPHVSTMGVPLPAAASAGFLAKANPVYVFNPGNSSPYGMRLTGVQALNNMLQLNAVISFGP